MHLTYLHVFRFFLGVQVKQNRSVAFDVVRVQVGGLDYEALTGLVISLCTFHTPEV